MDRREVRRGIQTIEINSARELYAQTVRARRPDAVTEVSEETRAQFVTPRAPSRATPRHKCNNPNNPACEGCGIVIIPSPVATLPLEDTPSISIEDWTITTRKKPILNSQELEQWEKNLTGLTLPEMIFGNSFVRIENEKHDWSLEFNAFDALSMVKKEDSGIRVSYAQKWIKSKKDQQQSSEIDESSLMIGQHYDWTYTTKYKGTVKNKENEGFSKDDSVELPVEKLSKPDPILFYDDMILFEDELADNGISILNIKIRVMNERLLLLSRFFLRVDDVLFRIVDTRVYVEFDENKVIREFKEYEGEYKHVLTKHKLSHSHDPKAALRDSNWVVQHLPLVNRECEVLTL